jgi:hypothetical protein
MKYLFLTFFICFILTSPLHAEGSAANSTASTLWQKGMIAAHAAPPDSALSLLKQSFALGLSDDSLYFLWSEIFLYRNILDTALALNFSIKPSSAPMQKKVFEQRYAIYSKLGWTNEAKAVRDSMTGKAVRIVRKIFPECDLTLSGGAYREASTIDRGYPYPRQGDSTATISDGIGDASLKIRWRISLPKKQLLQFGARLRYSGSRFSAASIDKRLNDSTDMSMGAYLRYRFLSDRLTAGYDCNLRKDFLGRESFLHQTTLQYAIAMQEWLASLSAGYQYRNPYRRHYYYLSAFFARPLGTRDDIGISCQLSGLSTDDHPALTQTCINVKDSKAYYDQSFTRPVDSTLGINFLLNPNIFDTIATLSIPQSFFGINPQLSHEHRFTAQFSSGMNAGYRLSWFQRKYEWYELHYTNGTQPVFLMQYERSELARDGATGNFYWIRQISARGRVVLDSTPVPVTIRSERRVDQTLSLNLFLNYRLNRFGSLLLDVTAERNFSTLTEAAPVDIQKWYGEIMLTWFFRFKP